jgi:plant G-box-binding factor
MEGVVASNHTLGHTSILPLHCFPAPVLKPTATNVADSRAVGAVMSPSPAAVISAHNGAATDLSIKVYQLLTD